ncbi:MAG: hypothetical protein JSR67_12935 [Proteobacteria bacterium]|nr:hypothetical protein [Pseudomonadota bacterium]
MQLDPQFQELLDASTPQALGGSGNTPPTPVTTDGDNELGPQFAELLADSAKFASRGDPNAAAAQAAYNMAQNTQQYLRVGPFKTGIPLPHWIDNTLGGMGGRALQLGQWAYQSLGGTPDPLRAAVAQQLQSGPAGKAGSFLTDVGLTAPLGGAVTSGLAKLGGVGARIAANTFGRAAVQGAVQGAATAPPGDRLQGAAFGTALSPVLPAVDGALSKLASGLTRTPEAQSLLDRGVQLTPGQMNPTGKVVNRLEQAASGLPLVGGLVANARVRGPQQFARTMLEDATAPGERLSPGNADFNDMIGEAQAGFDRAYDQTLQSSAAGIPVAPRILNPTQRNVYVPLVKAFQQLADQPRLGLTGTQRQMMGEQLQEKLAETVAVAKRAGGMTADDLQQLRSDLRAAARDVSPLDSASRAQKGFWNDAQQTVTQSLESQLPPDTAQALRAIDAQYGKFAIARRAAVLAKDQPGGPTPAQFSQAIKEATAPNTYAAGGGFNRDLSKAARGVFQTTIPHTGLTGIGTVLPIVHAAEGVGGALLSMHNPIAGLGIAGGLGAVAGAYTRPGLRLLAGQTSAQQAARRALGAVPPAAQEAISRYGRSAVLAPALQAPWMSPPVPAE